MKTPIKTVEFLDAIKEKYNLQSDYKLCKFTGLQKSSVSNYRVGKSCLDAPIALEIAYWLDLPEGYVLACIQAEREERAKRTEVAATWTRVAQAMRVAMLAGILVFLGLTAPQDAVAGTHKSFNNVGNNIHYTHTQLFRRRVRRLLRRLKSLSRSLVNKITPIFTHLDYRPACNAPDINMVYPSKPIIKQGFYK